MIIICTKITKIINWTTLDYTGWELFQMEPPANTVWMAKYTNRAVQILCLMMPLLLCMGLRPSLDNANDQSLMYSILRYLVAEFTSR